MSSGFEVNVDYSVVELIPKKRDKESESVFLESDSFSFHSSQCRAKVSYGWESRERKICKVYVRSQPLLFEKFYVTVYVFKGNQSIAYPKKVVLDPSKCIWSGSFADIEKRIPDAEKWNISFRLIFQTEYEPNCTLKNSGHKFVQTSCFLNKNGSLEKFSDDFARLLDVAGDAMYCDIEVKCGDIVVRVHKGVLIARWEFFKKNPMSLTKDRIELDRIDPAAFIEIVRYIYTGKLPDLSLEAAKNIYKAGDLCNTELREGCVEFLIENLTLENACECLTLADDEYFKGKITEYIIDMGIPFLDEYWKQFCHLHPKYANDVYDKLVRKLKHQKCTCGTIASGTFKKNF